MSSKKKTKSKKNVTSIIPAEEVTAIRKASDLVIHQAEDLTIKTSDDENGAYDVLQRIKERRNFIEKKRKEITGPLNKSLKATNAMFKELTLPLVSADGVIRSKIVAFHEKREAVAEKKRERLEARAEEAEEAGQEDKALALQEKADAVEPTVGKSTVTHRWTFDVIDLQKVPREYLLLDSVSVDEAIRDGARDIPGLRIYQKKGVSVRG